MEPIRNLKDYMLYRSILRDVNRLVQYYEKETDDPHDHTYLVQFAKRRLLSTKYKTLDGKNGRKVSIKYASDQQINSTFRKEFSNPKESISMPEYLKTTTRNWYEIRIKNFEKNLESLLPETASPDSLIAAEYIAKGKNNSQRAEMMHQILDKKLKGLPANDLDRIWNTYFPQSDIVTLLKSYSAFDNKP